MHKATNLIVFFLYLLIFTACHNTEIEETKENPISKIAQPEQINFETSEEKAVRLAEEFIKKNGYTDEPADKENISHESVEFYDNIDELLQQRKNTLENKAFGIFFQGRFDEKGFTVAFRLNKSKFKDLSDKDYNTLGRAVTMNGNFENLRVEHKSLFLGKVDKKF